MMRRRIERRPIAIAQLVASLSLVAGCSAGSGGGSNAHPAGGGASGSGGSTDVAAGSGGTTGTSLGIGSLAQSCATSALARPQLRRLTASELQRSLDDIFPVAQGKWAMGLSEVKSPLGFNNDPALLTVSQQVAEKLLTGAQALATIVTDESVLNTILPCSANAADHECAASFLAAYGPRLFRRPLSPSETDRYLAYFDAQRAVSDFRSALRWTLTALIQSPHAIYRREVGTPDSDTYRLSQYEIATELAYTFSGTTPTADLLQQASDNQLQTSDQITAAAAQLLATPNGRDVVHQFFKGWLGYDQLPPALPNTPTFAAVASDMVQETTSFIDQVVVADRGGYKEFLTAPFTTPSRPLAAFYEFAAPTADYTKVDRPAGRGIGLLAQGSIIAAHSHETASSPTLRGLLVFERLLCGQRPQVPPNVPTLVPASPGLKTTRQRYEEQHMAAGATCPLCHQSFDPLGFGFEHFDESGRYRQTEGTLTIDSTGEVLDQGKPVFAFSGLEDLATGLAAQEKVGLCVSGYVTAFAFANTVGCLGEGRRADFVAGRLGLLDYFASLAAEPSFTARR